MTVRRMQRAAIVVTAATLACGALAGQASALHPAAAPPDLVVLGDSFAAGTGNMPYENPDCGGRSMFDSYGKYLAAVGVARLQAVAACGGATTTEIAPQLPRITADTDAVTIQALGNDFRFGDIARLCIFATCDPGALLPSAPAATVQQMLDGIETDGDEKLRVLDAAIDARIQEVGSGRP